MRKDEPTEMSQHTGTVLRSRHLLRLAFPPQAPDTAQKGMVQNPEPVRAARLLQFQAVSCCFYDGWQQWPFKSGAVSP